MKYSLKNNLNLIIHGLIHALARENKLIKEIKKIIPPFNRQLMKCQVSLINFNISKEEFNRKLLETLQVQQNYIDELVDNRIATVQELKRLAFPDEKRVDRFEQIMTGHKVKRILEVDNTE